MWQSDLDAAKRDAGKPRLSLVPPQIIFDIAQVREYGNRKYGSADNWKEVELQRYIDALYRHMLAIVEDNRSRDAESGIEHYKHMACNMAFICQLMKQEGADAHISKHQIRCPIFPDIKSQTGFRYKRRFGWTITGRYQMGK